jgi:hypothetical protein
MLMRKLISRFTMPGMVGLVLSFLLVTPGCGGNSNEAEYLRSTSPGTPAEPQKVSERRSQTRSVSKLEKKLEDRNQAIAEKKAAGAK